MCLVIFDIVLESFEHYLHHYKGRFHQRLLNKVLISQCFGVGHDLTHGQRYDYGSTREKNAIMSLFLMGDTPVCLANARQMITGVKIL